MDTARVMIFDTTLRDGEQSAGFRLGAERKLEIARQLRELNVDVIEAGYPISSPEDFKAVSLIAEQIEGPVITALSRAVIADIDQCVKALDKAKRPRIQTGMGVSDAHILGKFKEEKYGRTGEEKRERLFQMSVRAVSHAKQYIDDIQFYAEDAGRCDWNYLFQVLEAVIGAGATVVNIPDTTGYSVPEQYGALIAAIMKNVPNINQAVISVHCHDDLGMAVANSLAGVINGARQVECTLNGIGERAGNAALEEIVMVLRTRRDYFGIDSDINTRELFKSSRMVAEAFDLKIPVNKAVVGANAFAHSSGIHVDGFFKDRITYEIMRPQDIGIQKSNIVLTARSGRQAMRNRLEEMGFSLSTDELERTYSRFLVEADQVNVVSDQVLREIAAKEEKDDTRIQR
jgi:2-isopropylmalate synthase